MHRCCLSWISPCWSPRIKSQAFRWSMSDCFCIEAAHSKAWPALLLYHPPSHLPNAGSACWPKGSPQEVGCVWSLGAWLQRHLLTQSWVISARTCPWHTLRMVGLIVLKTQAGPTLALIREMSFLADTDVGPDSCAAPCPASPTLQAQHGFGRAREHHISNEVLVLVWCSTWCCCEKDIPGQASVPSLAPRHCS